MPGGRAHPDRQVSTWNRGFRRVLAWMAVGSLSAAALVGLAVVVAGWRWDYVGQVLATTSLFGLSAALALACVWSREVIRPRLWQVLVLLGGAALAWVGWFTVTPAIWADLLYDSWGFYSEWQLTEFFSRFSVSAYFVSGAIAYAGLFALLRVRTVLAWMRRVGIGGAAVVAGSVVYSAIDGDPPDELFRAIAAAAIVAISLVVIVPICAVIFPSQRIRSDEAAAGEIAVAFTCPSCGTTQRIIAGRRVVCAGCGLGVELRLDTPRCACGYDLTGLTAATCPECGQEVPKKHRWAMAIQEPTAGAPMPDSSSALPTSSSTRSA